MSGELRDLVGVDRLELGDDPVERQQLGVGDQRLAEPGHSIGRRLHRQHDPAFEVLLCSRELGRSHVARCNVAELLASDLETRREILLAGAEVDADETRVGVLRRERIDRVRHPPLLANLLEETGRRRSAENRIEQGSSKTPSIRARDAGGAEAHVVLLRVLTHESESGRRRLYERTSHAWAAGGWPLLRL